MFRDLPSILREPPAEQHIWGIFRIFEKPEYRDAFLAGRIRFSTVGEYRKLEDGGDRLRGDHWEGVAACVESEGMRITIAGQEIGGVTGPLLHYPPGVDGWNICSFVAPRWPVDVPFDALDAPEVLEQIKIGPELRQFGDHVAVIVVGNAFLTAVRVAAEAQGLRVRAHLVQYFDEGGVSGSIPESHVGFVKRADPYAKQREFRIVVPRHNPEEKVLWLSLPTETPWGLAMTVDEFNSRVALREI